MVGAVRAGAGATPLLAEQELHLDRGGLRGGGGLLDLDDNWVSDFPEFDADITDPRSR